MKIKVLGYTILTLLLLSYLCETREAGEKRQVIELNKKRAQHLIDIINEKTEELGVDVSGEGIASTKIFVSIIKFSGEDYEFLKDIKIYGAELEAEIGDIGMIMEEGGMVLIEFEVKGVMTILRLFFRIGFSIDHDGIEVYISGLGIKLLGIKFGKKISISTPFGKVVEIDTQDIVNLFEGDGCYEEGEEQSGLLCYPKCHSGFTGVGPVCWQDCPSGFNDHGAFCFKPKPYGRGIGHFTRENCERGNDDCVRNGLLWYPKCAENYHNVGCCICSPDCPDGMADIGISCAKQSYGRGVGTPLEIKKE